MRESRTYGSMRGAPSNGRPYRNRCALITNSTALVAPLDSAVSGGSLNGRLILQPRSVRPPRQEGRAPHPAGLPQLPGGDRHHRLSASTAAAWRRMISWGPRCRGAEVCFCGGFRTPALSTAGIGHDGRHPKPAPNNARHHMLQPDPGRRQPIEELLATVGNWLRCSGSSGAASVMPGLLSLTVTGYCQ